MTFTENLYLKRMIQKLQEENNHLSNLVEYYQEYQQGGGMGPGMGSGMIGNVGANNPTTQLDYYVGAPMTTRPATNTSYTSRSRKPRLGPTSGGVSPVSGTDIQSSPTEQSTPSRQGPRRPVQRSGSSQQGSGGPQSGGARPQGRRPSSKPSDISQTGKLGPRKTTRGRNPNQSWWDRMFG